LKPISIKHVHDETPHVTQDDRSTSWAVSHDEIAHVTQDDPSESSLRGLKRTANQVD
jgi:hypothetical protein